ncbi:MAG TPA: hypothetical protein VF141_13725 [Chryseolinea sp.]
MGKKYGTERGVPTIAIAIKFMDINEYFLMSCPNMIGFNEGWVIDNHVFVSPAIFQLLTDEDDWQTRMCVARQLVLKQATYKDLKILLEATTPPRRSARPEVHV